MKYVIQGGTPINLKDQDFVAEGGEGKVYHVAGSVYKVYHDHSKVIPEGKVRELAAIHDPRVIRPEKLLYNPKGLAVGYVARYVRSGGVLCESFNRSWRDREGYTPERMNKLVEKLRTLILAVHAGRCLMVDLNEMNFLLSEARDDLNAIDVDSYQTPTHRATALMESVRDRHVKNNAFTEGSDWFSFAVLAFRMWVGLHPYRGKHPVLTTMDARMLANVSALNPEVSVPKASYPFTDIPPAYRDWFHQVLDKGARGAPPERMDKTVMAQVIRRIFKDGAKVKVTTALTLPADITLIESMFGDAVLIAGGRIYVNGRRGGPADQHSSVGVIRARDGATLPIYHEGDRVIVIGERGEVLEELDGVKTLRPYKGTAYAHRPESGAILIMTPTVVGMKWHRAVQLLNQGGQLFTGAAFQNLLGSVYAHLFVSPTEVPQVRLPELDKLRILDAKYDAGVLAVRARGPGGPKLFMYRVDMSGAYDLWEEPDADLDFAVLPSGVGVLHTPDKLTLFKAQYGTSQSRREVDIAYLPFTGRLAVHKGGLAMVVGSEIVGLTLAP